MRAIKEAVVGTEERGWSGRGIFSGWGKEVYDFIITRGGETDAQWDTSKAISLSIAICTLGLG